MLQAPNCPLCDHPLLADLCTPLCGHVFHSQWYSLLSIHLSLLTSFFCPVCSALCSRRDLVLLRISLGSGLEQTQSELQTVESALRATEQANSALNFRYCAQKVDLISATAEVAALQQDLLAESALRTQQQTALSSLAPLRAAAQAAFHLPAVQRAKDIQSICSQSEQADRLFTQVVALSSLRETEAERQDQLRAVIHDLESRLRPLRWKAKRLSKGSCEGTSEGDCGNECGAEDGLQGG